MGKRTIRKKRNTRKRNTFKRKKNTLQKYTLKRKKIILRKFGGSPRAEPPKSEPEAEPEAEAEAEPEPEPEAKSKEEKKEVRFSKEAEVEEIKGRTAEQRKKTRNSKDAASKRKEIGEYGDGKENVQHELRQEEIASLKDKAKYQFISNPDTVFGWRSRGRDKVISFPYVLQREDHVEQFNQESTKLKNFLENKSTGRLNPNGLLCEPSEIVSEIVYDIQTLLDDIVPPNFISNIENVKYKSGKKTVYTISREKLKEHIDKFKDTSGYPPEISLRWSELREKSKKMKSKLTSYRWLKKWLIDELKKSNNCFDRIVNINNFLAQFREQKLTTLHVADCMDILFSQ